MSVVLERIDTPPSARATPLKSAVAVTCAMLLSLLFLASGVWKISDLEATSERMVQSLLPLALSMPAAMGVAVCEILAGVLLLIPRHRRWGAWIAGIMLVSFMIYIGILYDRLLGEDCNCFPWIQRVVGPVFFVGDAAMLLLALMAGLWSRKSSDWRKAGAVLLAAIFATAVSYAVSSVRRSNADAPETAVVDGKPLDLRRGRLLLYFFDPECSHCYTVAREMSKRNWGATRIVVLPTRVPQWASSFLADTGIRAGVSPDAERLRKIFPFTDPPYAVALDRGRAVAMFNSGQMESETYYATLRRVGHLK